MFFKLPCLSNVCFSGELPRAESDLLVSGEPRTESDLFTSATRVGDCLSGELPRAESDFLVSGEPRTDSNLFTSATILFQRIRLLVG